MPISLNAGIDNFCLKCLPKCGLRLNKLGMTYPQNSDDLSSTTLLESALESFLKNKSLTVSTLKGTWGVGKTYFWNKFQKNNPEFFKDFKKYVYVSMFGVKSISDLRHYINIKTISTEDQISELKNTGKFSCVIRWIKKPFYKLKILLSHSKQKTENANNLWLKAVNVVGSFVENILINECFICIDDIERADDSLNLRELMGFVSLLVNERKCKILLIYNEEEMSSENSSQLSKYREKTIDLELIYKPSINQNLQIAWDCHESQIPEDFIENAILLNCANIRVLRHMRRVRSYFQKIMIGNYEHCLNSVLSNCDKISWIYYTKSYNLNFNNVYGENYYKERNNLLSKPDEAQFADEIEILRRIDYKPTSIDGLILIYLVDGFFNINDAKSKFEYEDTIKFQYQIEDEVHSLISEFYCNFSIEEKDYKIKLEEFLKENYLNIRPFEFAELEECASKIEMNLSLSNEKEACLQKYLDKISVLSDYRIPHIADNYPALKERILENLQSRTFFDSATPIGKQMYSLTSSSYSPNDIKFLLKFSSEDFYNWLTTDKDQDVCRLCSDFIKRYSQKFNFSEGSDGTKELSIIKKIQDALLRLRDRSLLDQLRVNRIIPSQPPSTKPED